MPRTEELASDAVGSPRGPSSFWRSRVALTVLVVAAGYYALAVVGTVLSVPPAGFAIIWPATAFLISVLLLTPVHHWWIYLLAVVPSHFHMVYHFQRADLPLVVVFCQITGNLTLAAITALTVRVANGRPLQFGSFQTLLKFVLLAGVSVPAVVNALVLCLFLLAGWTTDFWLSWRQWMLASVFPTITIPPLAVLAFGRQLLGHGADLPKFYAELGLLVVALSAVCALVFSWDHPQPEYVPTLLLAPVPFLLWAALRLGVGGTCVSLLVFAGTIAAAALAGRGPFATSSPIEDVLSLQVFLLAVSVPIVLLAGLVEERTQADTFLRQSEERLLTLQQGEQQRIAADLHDSTVQHLTAMALNLTSLKIGASTSGGTAKIVEELEESLKEATRELRSFSYLLYPIEVERDGFVSTLQRYVDGFAARTRLRANVKATGTFDKLPLALQIALLRIVQESLANVYRHASASRVTIKLSRVGRRLHLVIRDDGTGLRDDPQTQSTTPLSLGVGIPGMQARMRKFGGTLDVHSRPSGTIVHAVVPS